MSRSPRWEDVARAEREHPEVFMHPAPTMRRILDVVGPDGGPGDLWLYVDAGRTHLRIPTTPDEMREFGRLCIEFAERADPDANPTQPGADPAP
jgi:hypothetical protein